MRRRFGVQIATEPQRAQRKNYNRFLRDLCDSVAPNVPGFQDSEYGVE